ncbi:MAG: PD40 domain-containing protein [Chloroflexi bacterium]|nr:PD40 domain-containing protein [Chloroflexota bacterium]
MTGINHKQAQRYLRAAADGLLRENQRALLDAHLRECGSCRAEAEELSALEARLKKNFQARWDANDGPSKNVMTTIQSRSRRIMMTNRINTTLKTAAGLAALLLLTVLLNSLLGRFRSSAVPGGATQTNEATQSTQAERLIAYVSVGDGGNYEIFTMKADGSEMKNLTNNPATDDSPAWSPDGTRIAFVSDRDGGREIYLMNADGSSVRKLTDSSTFNDHFTWSPDGTKIVYFSVEDYLFDDGNLMIMNADGSNKTPLTSEPGKYKFLSWSPDGQHIVFQSSDSGEGKVTHLFVANLNGGGAVIDGPFFEGDAGRQHQQVYWKTPTQFVTISSNFEQTTWGKWNITRFFTDGDNSRYNGSNPILVTSENPIFAIFENTYVTLEQGSLAWFSYEGAPIPYSPWKMDSTCEDKVTFDLQKAPDGKHGFVSVYCEGGSSSLFLINSDGTEIKQLGATLDNVTPLPFPALSPDGKQLLLALTDQRKVEYYRVDIEKMLSDPSAQPVQLTTDGAAYKYGAVWQPQP